MRRLTGAAVLTALIGAGGTEAQAQDYFGSIAYDTEARVHGYALDHRSQQAAEEAALADCRTRANSCVSAIWFRNACGALAIGSAGWGAHWGNDQQQAEARALQKCYEFTIGCKVERWACTRR